MFWKMDLHNLFHFLNLRADSHAQWEIRQYAYVIGSIVKDLFPISFNAWYKYVYTSENFTHEEIESLTSIDESANYKVLEPKLNKKYYDFPDLLDEVDPIELILCTK